MLPVMLPSESSGSPYRKLDSAMPHRSGAPTLATVFAQRQNDRHRVLSRRSAHSNETARTTRRTSRASRAR